MLQTCFVECVLSISTFRLYFCKLKLICHVPIDLLANNLWTSAIERSRTSYLDLENLSVTFMILYICLLILLAGSVDYFLATPHADGTCCEITSTEGSTNPFTQRKIVAQI
eukprot:UN22926